MAILLRSGFTKYCFLDCRSNSESLCMGCVSASYLFVDLQKLLYRHFFILGNPEGSVDAPKAASSTVLIEKQVLMFYLYKRRARGRHGILTHIHSNTHMHTSNPYRGKNQRHPPSTTETEPQISTEAEWTWLSEGSERMLSVSWANCQGEETRKCWKGREKFSPVSQKISTVPADKVLYCLTVVVQCNCILMVHTHRGKDGALREYV